MPWEKAFDRNEIIEFAMHQFWDDGFQKTSIAAISERAGASRYGLYDEFGDKQGLYIQALQHYSDQIVTELLAPLEHPDATVETLLAYRDRLLGLDPDETAYRGCLMCLAAMEMAEKNQQVADMVEAHFQRQRRAFLNCLRNSADTLAGRPEDLADTLFLALQGISMFARAGYDIEKLRRTLEGAFAVITLPADG